METDVKRGPQVTKSWETSSCDGYTVTFTLEKLDKLSLSPEGPLAPKIPVVPLSPTQSKTLLCPTCHEVMAVVPTLEGA